MAMQSMLANTIICGDCKERIPQRIPPESIDLIYLDPPFFSGRNYEIIWNDGAETRSFEDKEFYKRVCGKCEKNMPPEYMACPYCGASVDQAKDIRMNDIEAYIEWLRERIKWCYRALKPTGSIYVHLDWHAVHYVKVMMDTIFGYNNFQNELIWYYTAGTRGKRKWARKHDNILFYTKSNDWTFNWELVAEPFESGMTKWRYTKGGQKGKPMPPGKVPTDVFQIQILNTMSKERLGYPTQKPEALLERIIEASSNPGELILDPFCGCGTAVAVAQKLGRRWIGIDVSPTSCRVMVDRLRKDGYSIGEDDILDMPITIEELMKRSPFEFQNIVVDKIGGKSTKNKSGDRGIDGYTFDRTPIQVKQNKSGSKVGNPTVRAFAQDIRDVDKDKGIIIAFGFAKTAHDEVKHIAVKHGVNIKLVTVEELLNSGTECAIFD